MLDQTDGTFSVNLPVTINQDTFSFPPAPDYAVLEELQKINVSGVATLCLPENGEDTAILQIQCHVSCETSHSGWAQVSRFWRLLPWLIHGRYMEARARGEGEGFGGEPIRACNGEIVIMLLPQAVCVDRHGMAIEPEQQVAETPFRRRRQSAIA